MNSMENRLKARLDAYSAASQQCMNGCKNAVDGIRPCRPACIRAALRMCSSSAKEKES